ncbi:F510_1955 family glycosylhydrolase [Bacillus sp. PS06]|uniref:F510_1955 family glycosylhydrolase n=1 Tax=Bacillus sp. PS06 TaxID=2764176 RepID=UPI00177F560A|nr:hypothetical protein [Bacillus sp. PS06]MBD8067793.1 hypothetical protein [Bacillus sp. PS06]
MKKLIILISTTFLLFGFAACGQVENSEQDLSNQGTGQPDLESKKMNEEIEPTDKETEQTSEDGEQINQDLSQSTSNIEEDPYFESFEGSIDHVHGLGYAGNQNAIFFAAHDGLKIFTNGKWYKTKAENNDYMGFNAVEKGFFSSGHPGKDSSLPNPFGVMRSTDNGQTLETLGLLGETDFHLMGVGYETNSIYAIPPNNNSEMEAGGLYVSEDDAKSWRKVKAENLGENLFHLAVHPTKAEIVAAAGEDGIYLSEDRGETFELLTNGFQGTTVYFSDDDLWYGGFNGKAILMKKSILDGSEKEIPLPKLEQDAVMYMAQNPNNENELVFVSFNGDIYKSTDDAKTWTTIVKNGVIQ